MRTRRLAAATLAGATALALPLSAVGSFTAQAADSTYAIDSFSRIVTTGLGVARTGGAWASTTLSQFSVNGYAAKVTVPAAGQRRYAWLPGVSARDISVETMSSASAPANGWGQVTSVAARRGTDGQDYEARLRVAPDGSVNLTPIRRDGLGVEIALGPEVRLAGLTAGPNTPLHLRLLVTGANPSTVAARAWKDGTAEPGTWQVSATDATAAVQDGGAVGISAYLGSGAAVPATTFTFNELSAVSPGLVPQPPVPVTPPPTHVPNVTPPPPPAVPPLPPLPVPTEVAGAAPLGTTAYPVPATAVVVDGVNGNGTAAGTLAAPYKTLGQAVAAAPAGATIVLRAGTYHESVTWYAKQLTIQNYPGEVVWLDGSTAVSGFVADGTTFRHDGWTAQFPQGGVGYLVDPATNPLAAFPDMVRVDGASLKQVASKDQVVPGTFFVDYAADAIYLGSDPSGHAVTASDLDRAVYINHGDGSVVRGIGVRNYATHPTLGGAIYGDADNLSFENDVFANNASVGLSVHGAHATVRHNDASGNGEIGLHAHQSDYLTLAWNHTWGNNTEAFKMTGAEGGVKVTTSAHLLWANNISEKNLGRGLWCDIGCQDVTMIHNTVRDNADRGIQFEISSRLVFAENYVTNNSGIGLDIVESNNADIYNNTFYRNLRDFFAVEGSRTSADTGGTGVSGNVGNVHLVNNVFDEGASGAASLIGTEDTTRTETGAQMGVSLDYNVYGESATSPTRFWVTWANYPAGVSVYSTLGAYQAGTGNDGHSFAVTGQALNDPSNGDFRVAPTSPSIGEGAALPANVAGALGLAAGTVLDPGAS